MTSHGVDPKLFASLSGAELSMVYLNVHKVYIVHSFRPGCLRIAHEI
jgi:hypothetical protein